MSRKSTRKPVPSDDHETESSSVDEQLLSLMATCEGLVQQVSVLNRTVASFQVQFDASAKNQVDLKAALASANQSLTALALSVASLKTEEEPSLKRQKLTRQEHVSSRRRM